MNNHRLQHEYLWQLLATVPSTATWEVPIVLSVELDSPMWFIVIDKNIDLKEERLFYHRKTSNIVYVYWVNRSLPVVHDIWSQVVLDPTSSINYILDNLEEQNYIYQKSEQDVIIKWGNFFINWEMVEIPDLDTEWAWLLVLWQDNNVYIDLDNWEFVITTDELTDKFYIWEIFVELSWNISWIDTVKTKNISNWLSSDLKDKLINIDTDLYERLANKTTTIRDISLASDILYPTELAVATWLDWKVDKIAGKWLSTNDFTDLLKDWLDDLLWLDLSWDDYEKLANKTTTIRDISLASDILYPTELAVATWLDWKVDKIAGKGLSTNDFTDLLKDKLDWLENITWLENAIWEKGITVSVSDWVATIWLDYVTMTSTWAKNISVFPIWGTAAHWQNEREILDTQMYIVLPDEVRSWFYWDVNISWITSINRLRVYTQWSENWKMLIQTHIRVVDLEWNLSCKRISIPYQVDINTGHSYFDLKPESFTWLDLQDWNTMYVQIFRHWVWATDPEFTQNWDIDDYDTLTTEVRVKSMYINYEIDSIPDNQIIVQDEWISLTPSNIINFIWDWVVATYNNWVIDVTIPWWIDSDTGNKMYIHNELSANNIWNITHPLNTEDIILQCYDENNNPIEINNYDIIDASNIQIELTDSIKWKCVILWKTNISSWWLPWSMYIHTQWSTSNTWSMSHGLDTEDIILQCYDQNNNPIQINDYTIVDSNNVTINLTDSISWKCVILWQSEPSSTSVNDKNYTESFTNVSSWITITHNLGKYCNVVVVDSSLTEIISSVQYVNLNTVNVTWVWSNTGMVICN